MRNLICIIVLSLSLIGIVSCGDLVDTSDNGKLDGYWLLSQVDSIGSGQVAKVVSDRKFLSVQGTFVQMEDRDDGTQYIFRFTFVSDTLRLSDARRIDRNEPNPSDPVVLSVDILRPYGINSLTPEYKVETLTGSRLVMSDGVVRLHYRKM